MRAKTSEQNDGWHFFERLYERGNEAVSQLLEDLLGSTKVTDRIGKTVGHATDAKRRVDRNMQFLLSLLNLPSRADYNRLLAKLETVQGSMVNLSMKLDRLLAAQEQHGAAKRRSRPSKGKAHHQGHAGHGSGGQHQG